MTNSISKKTENVSVESGADWAGATIITGKPSFMSRLVVVWLAASIVWSTLFYGTVDLWAQALLILGAGLMAWLWLGDAFSIGELRFSRSLLQLPLLALILLGLLQLLPLRTSGADADLLPIPISSAFSLDQFATKLTVSLLIAVLIYFAAALAFLNTQERLQNLSAFLIVFGFALAVFGILQFFSAEGKIYWFRQTTQSIGFGPYLNQHHFAALMEMIAALTLGLLYSGAVAAEKRALHIFAAVIMLIALVLTSSRGALISLTAILIFLSVNALWLRRRHKTGESSAKNNRLLLATGSFGLLLLVFAVVLFLGADQFLLRGLGINAPSEFSNGRFEFWQTTARMIADNPLFGVGLGAFGAAYTRYDPTNGFYRLEQAHNDYLQMWAEGGIFALLLVVAFIALLYWRGFQVLRHAPDKFRRGLCLGALAGCTGVLLHSLFDFPLRIPANLLIFLTLAALATVEVKLPKLYRPRARRRKSSNSEE